MLAVVLALALVAVLVWAGRTVWDRLDRTPLEQALAVAPAEAKRVTFTDWSAVRAAVGSDLGDTPSRDDVDAMVAAAYDRDLAAASGVDEAAGAMQELFGFGPGTARWEVFTQASEGTTLALRLPDGTDFDVLGDNLERAGFTRPTDDAVVWEGGIDLVAGLDPTLSPVVQYVVLLPDEHLVVTSDEEPYAASAAELGSAALDVDGVPELAERLGEPAAAVLWTGDVACADLSMASADPTAQAEAARAVEDAGGLSPLQGFALGLDVSGDLRVVAHLESADQAEADLRPRAELAAGPAYGRSGDFTDDLEITRARTLGSDVVLDLRPTRDGTFPLSGLYDGPLVFAGC